MNTVNNNLQTRQSYELAYKVGQQFETILNSKSYCSSKYINIPNNIQISAGKNSNTNLNYILRIYDFPSDAPEDKNKLVFTIMNKRNKEISAAYDVDYNGIVNFYEYDYNVTNDYQYTSTSQDYLDFIPTNKDSIDNKIIISKKIKNGKEYIYIFACDDYLNKPACHFFLENKLITDKNVTCLCIIPEISENVNACN